MKSERHWAEKNRTSGNKRGWMTSSQNHLILVLGLAAVAFTVLPTKLAGHRAFSLRRNNRYAILVLEDTKIRLLYSVLYGRVPAAQIRRDLDQSTDGLISPEEATAGANRMLAALESGIHLNLNGDPLPPTKLTASILLGGNRGVSTGALELSIEGRWSICPGRHTLRYEDDTYLAAQGETHVQLRPGPAIRILESHAGNWSSGIETLYTFKGPKSKVEDRSITVVFSAKRGMHSRNTKDRPDGPSRGGSHAWWLILLLGAIGAIGSVGLAVARCRQIG